MKFINTLLPFAAASSAFVIPSEQMSEDIAIESKRGQTFFQKVHGNVDDLWNTVEAKFRESQSALDDAINAASEASGKARATVHCHADEVRRSTQQWLDSAVNSFDSKPKLPSETVYELISSSDDTSKFKELIDDYPDIVKALKSTKTNYTVFAPTNEAFEKIPDHDKQLDKEALKQIVSYHISPELYSANRLLATHTIPSELYEEDLGGAPQRLHIGAGIRGLVINSYAHVVSPNIFAKNGVIHGVESLIMPPAPTHQIIDSFPGEYSVLQAGLERVGLFTPGSKPTPHKGGTIFAPSNYAFQKLGEEINDFLLSDEGKKYLRAILEYHIVANQTLYSDAFFRFEEKDKDVEAENFHVELPTLLKGNSLYVDIASSFGVTGIRVNGFTQVEVADGIAKDGVLHTIDSVLVPPKDLGAGAELWSKPTVSLEEFKGRFKHLVREEL